MRDPTGHKEEEPLVKVIDEHNVAVRLASLRIEDPAAIVRDRKAASEVLVHLKDCAYLPGGEIKVAEGSGRLGRNKVDTSGKERPKFCVSHARQSIHF